MAESFSVERRKLMRFLGAKVVLTPARREGHRHGRRRPSSWPKKHGWFLTPPVRERGQRRHPLAHHGARDPRRLRRRAARLLGHRLRHRRHAEGRRARAGEGAAGDRRSSLCEPDNAPMLGSGTPQAARPPTARPAASHPALRAAPDPGLDARLHPQAHRRCGRRRSWSIASIADRRRRGDAAGAASSRSKEGIFVGISGGATFAGGAAGRRRTRRRARPSSACCPTPASATSDAAVRRASRWT